MITTRPERPYLDAWLRRTRKQFGASGRLTQTALALSLSEGGSVGEWRVRLRQFLENTDIPTLDLLTKIDLLLTGVSKLSSSELRQNDLFESSGI